MIRTLRWLVPSLLALPLGCGAPVYVPSNGHFIVAVGDSAACGVRESHVKITDSHLVIDEKIQFAYNEARILPQSDDLLAEVASVLREHPEIEHVEVQGHTSGEGDAARNRALSQARAEAVLRALVQEGVASSRLSAKGYGAARLLVPERGEDDREINRRVEFLIVQVAGKKAAPQHRSKAGKR